MVSLVGEPKSSCMCKVAEIEAAPKRLPVQEPQSIAQWLQKDLEPHQYTNTSTAACSADFTTSSNFRSFVFGSLSFADTSGTPVAL